MIEYKDLPWPDGVTVIPYPEGRDQWLSARHAKPWRIGASEASALFNETDPDDVASAPINHYSSPYSLACAKLGAPLEAKDQKLARKGHRYEKAIVEDTIDELNDTAPEGVRYEVVWLPEYCSVVNTAYPSLAATPDAMVVCWVKAEEHTRKTPTRSVYHASKYWDLLWFGPVEVKRVRFTKRDEWEGEPPIGYLIQNQVQMLCCGCDKGVIGGLVSDDLKVSVIDRYAPLCDTLVEATTTFLQNLHDGIMPRVDGSEATTRALNKLYRAKGDTPIDLPAECWDLPLELERAKEEVKAAETKRDEIANRIKAALGENTVATYPGGSISWKEQTRAEHFVKASTFRVLRVSAKKGK
jgi:hypothetical protein